MLASRLRNAFAVLRPSAGGYLVAVALLYLLLASLTVPAGAQPSLALPKPEASASAAPQQTIGDTSEAGSDDRIGRRIEGIFAAVPALGDVTVSVREGVVSLGGTAGSAEDIKRAEQIASRITGVVTVENGIERDISVEESFQSLGDASGLATSFLKMLPLIGISLLVAAAIIMLGHLLASSSWLWRRLAPNGFLAELIASAVRFVFAIGGILIGLQMIGAGALLGAVLGGAGIVGIALGFAMQDTIENYVASIMLSVRQPFRANDWVRIGEYEGRIIRLTSRATIMMTLDGNHLRIPNSTVFKAVILNYTRNPRRRFEFELGIDADSDPDRGRRLGVAALASLDFVLHDPPPSARLEYVGDSNLVLKFLGWIDQRHTDWYKARSRAIPAVKKALEDAGFALPEPIYRLRFDEGVPLQVGQVAADRVVPTRSQAATVVSDEAAGEHVAPDADVADMVERERQQGEANEKDLLDSRRPVE